MLASVSSDYVPVCFKHSKVGHIQPSFGDISKHEELQGGKFPRKTKIRVFPRDRGVHWGKTKVNIQSLYPGLLANRLTKAVKR